jgi:hypothetical protein
MYIELPVNLSFGDCEVFLTHISRSKYSWQLFICTFDLEGTYGYHFVNGDFSYSSFTVKTCCEAFLTYFKEMELSPKVVTLFVTSAWKVWYYRSWTLLFLVLPWNYIGANSIRLQLNDELIKSLFSGSQFHGLICPLPDWSC